MPRAGKQVKPHYYDFIWQRKDKLRRIQLCVTTLESINDKWFTYTQQIVTMKRREEEGEKYKAVTEDDQGIFQLLHEGKEAKLSTFTRSINIKSTTTKPEQKQRYNPEGTSALSTIKDNRNTSKTTTTKRRPFVFYNQDHWDSDCVIYTTLNARLNRLKLQQNALALFDIGSKLSFISKKLSHQLKLTETETQIMKIVPFGMKEPKSCPTAYIQLNVLTTENEIIPLQANVIDYLTNELQVVKTSSELQIQNLTNYWKKPDVLIGADYFFKSISLREIKELKSGHMLVQSKVGPMIAGSGDIEKLCKNELYPKEVVYSTNANINSELEKFWKEIRNEWYSKITSR
ncbi:unnamed protein product [Brugia pahangi]|uniref:DUF1758 domain-containing protein n=1 Tax=Brugia pahangi TaxID=6280 RepID=A0A0N4TUD2_BRUPA|nr:unnamed protein product [Brugia pahangi]